MKNIFFVFVILILLFSCGRKSDPQLESYNLKKQFDTYLK